MYHLNSSRSYNPQTWDSIHLFRVLVLPTGIFSCQAHKSHTSLAKFLPGCRSYECNCPHFIFRIPVAGVRKPVDVRVTLSHVASVNSLTASSEFFGCFWFLSFADTLGSSLCELMSSANGNRFTSPFQSDASCFILYSPRQNLCLGPHSSSDRNRPCIPVTFREKLSVFHQ